MKHQARSLLALSLLAVAPVGFAQYSMTLTGAGDGVAANGVFVSPYQGTIQLAGNTIYSGFMICDDFNTKSSLNTPWQAGASSSNGVLNGGEKFIGAGSIMFEGNTYTAQQAYNAASWAAAQLVIAGNATNPAAQIRYSFAIWNIFDNNQADSSAAVLLTEEAAFTHANDVQSNVTVYTPSAGNPHGINETQEFLVVNRHAAPEINAASAGSALTLLLGGFMLLRRRIDSAASSTKSSSG